MPLPLNPFLSAFFRSSLPSQCHPASNHVLLVPTTEVLLACKESDSGLTFAELPALDEFLASHVIRMPNPRVAAAAANAAGGKDGIVNLREIRGKAKPYSTFNGRSVVIKDNMVYSNKGFKTMNHAALISDTIWYGDMLEPKPWLIYYISRPLIGSWEEIKTTPAILPAPRSSTSTEGLGSPAAGAATGTPAGASSKAAEQPAAAGKATAASDASSAAPRKKDIKSFHDLLNHFPIIARQMHPGLDKIFREFTGAFEQRLPPPPTAKHVPDPEPDGPIKTAMKRARINSAAAATTKPPVKFQPGAGAAVPAAPSASGSSSDAPDASSTSEDQQDTADGHALLEPGDVNSLTNSVTNSTNGSSLTNGTNGSDGQPTDEFFPEDDEHVMRASLESAITTAIDIFQGVDKQQLSLLGATTDLTGPLVERLIERYVSENVHHIIFPRLRLLKRQEDLELEAKIRQMDCVDISQLGMDIDGGARNKHELTIGLGRAVEEFRKIGSAMCPQEMLTQLLATVKAVTHLTHIPSGTNDGTIRSGNGSATGSTNSGDQAFSTRPGTHADVGKPLLTVNADTLVSLLLYVVIRAQVRNLLARFVYMRHFIFIDDVDSGEMGYALSTFEAVLLYLVRDSSGLRRVSRRNKALWEATAKGDLAELKAILEPPTDAIEDDEDCIDSDGGPGGSSRNQSISEWESSLSALSFGNGISSASSVSSRRSSIILSEADSFSTGSGLGHVFPFQSDEAADGEEAVAFPQLPVKRIKRVAMDTRSLSSNSDISYRSRSASFGSGFANGFERDTSVEKLSQTHNSFGESILMMAVQNERKEALEYMLSLEEFFPPSVVLADINHEDTTLLSAAVQLGNESLIMVIIDFLVGSKAVNSDRLALYFAQQDIWGRSVGHYLFHAPFLIPKFGNMVPWRQKDKNGQTPLFALCRSYDHTSYHTMVDQGLHMATITQGDGRRLHLDDHVDARGNTLLHIINDAQLAIRILQHCDVDVNAINDKKFTPLMVASKYGRFDMVRALFGDPRVDLGAKELRGLTAVELAKDDEVRNKIDDLTLLSLPAGPDGRTTAVVRSYFVEDATVRFVLKSGAAVNAVSYAVTTCRRSLTDFEHLTKLLALENPASWIPSVSGLRSPFQIPSKPSRAMLKDLQVRMDWFLRMMLLHPTFSTHEMLWEFILVPDIQPDMMAQRSKLKAETRAEKVNDELEPLEDAREVEQFVDHARELVRSVNYSAKSVIRRTNMLSITAIDLHDAVALLNREVVLIEFLPPSYKEAMDVYRHALVVRQNNAHRQFLSAFLAIQTTVEAILVALGRPTRLISQIQVSRKQMERNYQSVSRSTRWPLGLLDDARQRLNEEREGRAMQSRVESENLSKELRYTQQTVASELAGWQDMHERVGRRAIRELARGMLVQERDRLEAMERALRRVRQPAATPPENAEDR